MDFEKLGAFYLGRRYDPATGLSDEPLLYDAASFEPWIDPGDAARRRQTVAQRAAAVANQ